MSEIIPTLLLHADSIPEYITSVQIWGLGRRRIFGETECKDLKRSVFFRGRLEQPGRNVSISNFHSVKSAVFLGADEIY